MKETYKNVATIVVTVVVMIALVFWVCRGWLEAVICGVVLGVMIGMYINHHRKVVQARINWLKDSISAEELDSFLWDEDFVDQEWYLERACTKEQLERLIKFYREKIHEIWSDETRSVEDRLDDSRVYGNRLRAVNWHMERRG